MIRLRHFALFICGVFAAYLTLAAPSLARAADITCPGDLRATANFSVPAVNEYRLNGTGPGLPSESYISSDTDPVYFVWTLHGPGSWDIVLEWWRPPAVPDWLGSGYNDTLVLRCLGSHGESEQSAGPPATNLYDGRLNNNQSKDVAAPIAVYCGEGTIEVYAIDAETGDGNRIISVPQVEGLPASTQLLGSAQGVSLYWLDSGEYQVNASNFDGTPYIIAWTGCNSLTLVHL